MSIDAHEPRCDQSRSWALGGQTIDLSGLLCLFDAEGPCANPVKDAQRTKTSPATTQVRCVVWGTTALPGFARSPVRQKSAPHRDERKEA